MASRRAFLLLAAALVCGMWSSSVVAVDDDWLQGTTICKYKWSSSMKTADCVNASLNTIPSGLSDHIQSLTLNNNDLKELYKDAFSSVGLINLHKIYLQNCHIKKLDVGAFRGLAILIELHLSHNEITKLHSGTFSDTVKLRRIDLQHNHIQRLDDNLFVNLIFLQKIDLSYNQLNHIGHKTFRNVSKLSQVELSNNNLTHITPEPFLSLPGLNYLVLRNNPWHCDCQLKEFHLWSKNKSIDASCHEPQSLRDQTFNQIKSSDLDCNFKIVYPHPGTTIRANSGNISLNCQVVGYPRPDVHWVFNSRIVETYWDHRLILTKAGDWANLTIVETQESDEGTYTCVANGSRIFLESPVRLQVGGATIISGETKSDFLWLILGLVIGVLLLLIFVVVLFCCFCRRTRSNDKKSMQPDGGGMGLNGEVNSDTEQGKSLLVNPVQKPPRRAEMQPLVTNSSTTQLSSMKGPFMDNGSVFMGGSSDDRTLDRSSDSVDSQRDDNEPPDLLSFPSRGSQVSPAGSTASTAPDSTRLPMQSPIHHYAHSLCGTLPHSRSQSPFTPLVLNRPGYVTIPRRPRVPSWSSMPASSPVGFPGDPLLVFKLEPVYDNLGVRTTADGSSVLSLNKLGETTPMRGRPLPPTPVHYAPIQETELQPSPMLSRASNRSTPNIDTTPNRTSPEGAYQLRAEEKKGTSNGHAGSRNSQKVPPKPPPKPKKKKTSDLVSPLYEDEGEDGTEV